IADRAGKFLFVVDAHSSTVAVLDLSTGHVTERIPTGKSPEGASLSPSGKEICVCGEDDNTVGFIDVAAHKQTRSIGTQGKKPERCEYSRDEHWLLTSDENSNDVDIIDLAQGKSIALVHTAGHPRGIAILPDGKSAYVAQETSGGVDVIDIAAHNVTKSIK